MKRHSRGSAFDISIRGDELEHHRIQLEHNLQNTEISFHLSSTSDDEDDDGRTPRRRRPHKHHHHHQHLGHANESVEYPRHLSEPDMMEMPSFVHHHRSREHQFGDEDHDPMHGWSYRTGDDEEGISPYGGHTASSVAHHASAVTITAGLGGGRGARRDVSLSGAEYDPERPLHAIMANVNNKHSLFDADPSKSQVPNNVTYDPLVVDSTAELDRILESGHVLPQAASRSMSVHPTPPTSSASDSDSPRQANQASRPKLTDHLRHVSFSPKRPRTAQSGSSNAGSPPPGPSRNLDERNTSAQMPTPRPARRNIFPSYGSSPAQPEVRLQPATPSSTGSKFTRMARGINKELEATQEQLKANKNVAQPPRPASAPVERNPFHDVGNQSAAAPELRTTRLRRNGLRDSSNGKVQLPDVTGLTSAVESPAKPGVGYYPYKGDDRPRDSEVRLLQTLSAVQAQLLDLEDENGISRRRIRELEMELEECKRDVARERTRLFEREEQHARSFAYQSKNKGKAKATDAPEIDDERLHARYKEAVEEKKALEALINSLRSHLTRLTTELASHSELLAELRRLRDSDSDALKEKGAEILQLKEEVQRLAGEVEVLRGVVEEGLKERRASREITQLEESAVEQGVSHDSEEEVSEEEDEDELQETEDEEDDQVSEEVNQESLHEEASRPNRADRTMRTDVATMGSSHLGGSTNQPPRFVEEEELGNIEAELEERRSNNSNGSIGSPTRRSRSPSPIRRRSHATVEEVQDDESHTQMRNAQPQVERQPVEPPQPSTSRPSAPTPGHARKHYGRSRHEDLDRPEPETPFPQIRGEHLERLFFSAPEHNAKTCTVCYRRRYRAGPTSPSWSHPRRASNPAGQRPVSRQERHHEEEDEGYVGSDGGPAEAEQARTADKGKQREHVAFSEDPAHWRKAGKSQGLPPQTVVARVIRELEDDFTHYKSVYVELADQYKVMDAVSDVPRRNMLARHLREVVDILEQKGDQIASLYDLLEFKDKPVSESIVPKKGQPSDWTSNPIISRPPSRRSRVVS